LTGTPDDADVGVNAVRLTVTDEGSNVIAQEFTIEVTNVNDIPVFTSTPVTAATQEVVYTYSVSATDDDLNETLTITATTLPAWLVLNPSGAGAATLTGRPTNDEVGTHEVVLVVTDASGATDTQSFTVAVANTNDVPTMIGFNTTILEDTPNGTVIGTVTANDLDNDPLTFAIVAGDSETTFRIDATSGEVTVANTDLLDAATTPQYVLTVEVTDGEFTAETTVVIEVDAVTGISDELLETLVAYPNPTEGMLRIRADFLVDHPEAELTVFNARGLEVPVTINRSSADQFELQLRDLVSGVYYVRVQVDGAHRNMMITKY
ncbi:MAG TPA: hypothetical protein DCR93_37510, partial [Cytophagales bacterium]|nr:hypothetical protein [Cytophagales bacterium]